MNELFFFPRLVHTLLADIAAFSGAAVAEGADLSPVIKGVAPFGEAGPGDLTFLDPPYDAALLKTSRATACFVTPHDAPRLAKATLALVIDEPYVGFARAMRCLFPQPTGPISLFGTAGINPGASIHPEARLEQDVTVDPGAIVGPRAEIGSGSIIGANSVIGANVRVGRNCLISPQVTVSHALIGDRVILHPGVRIGQPGVRPASNLAPCVAASMPEIGRVIIQDGVEIGANSTIDRGPLGDTVLGEEARIGDLVHIGANVMIGRFCNILAQARIMRGAPQNDLFDAPLHGL